MIGASLAVNRLALAGFLSALGFAHAAIAAYCLFIWGWPDASGAPPRAPDSAPSRDLRSSPPPGQGWARPRTGERRRDRGLAVFGLLNLAVVALDGGLAWAEAVGADRARWAMIVAHGGRIAAAFILVDFVLQYSRVLRAAWATAAIYCAGGFFLVADVLGLLHRYGDLAESTANFLGVPFPDLRAPPTALGAGFAVLWGLGVVTSLLSLARALSHGRREAMAFAGMAMLSVASLHDVLTVLGLAQGPPLCPYGYFALVNGVMMTLLSRFSALRGQLESRARELKERTRELGRANDELRDAQDQLVRKEQLAAIGELAAVIAHEVRNPLAIISNAVSSLRRQGLGEEDTDTLLTILDEESSRLNRLVGDLLRYARPVNLERQSISLRELVERGLALTEGHGDLVVDLVEPDPVDRVLADANLLRQVIDNLINNAVQAMNGAGTLTLMLVNLEREGKRGVELQIQDTGEGMDTLVRTRALDPFFTTRPSGTGLGLAIVARIVDAHGGALTIRSKAGQGTVVHVFLPISAEPPPRTSQPEGDRPSSEPPMPSELRRALKRTP